MRPTAATVLLVLLVTAAVAGPKLRRASPRDVAAMQAAGTTVVFLDTRDGDASNAIPGAVALPEDRVDVWAATADRAPNYVAYCT
jgi:hypothetical protein